MSTMDAVTQDLRSDGFINLQDSVYLDSYAVENMIDLVDREKLNQFDNLYAQQTEIKRTGRAKVIDHLF